MRLRSALLPVALLTLFSSAHAGTINVFNLVGSTSAGALSGTLSLDAATGKFTDSAIKFQYTGTTILGLITGTTYNFTGAPTSTTTGTGYSSNDFAGTGGASLLDFDLTLPLASLVNYTGGALCSTAVTCSNQASAIELLSTGLDYARVTSGTLTLAPVPAAVTPEPSALLLLGTGVLGLGILLRKRYA